MPKKRNLKPAHKGYRYQDLATAYLLAEALVHRFSSVTVDKKIIEGDRIDDVEVIAATQRIRRQFKSSIDKTRRLQVNDFIGKTSSLRFDHLIHSYTQAGKDVADEYRLCATWKVTDEEDLVALLDTATVPSTIDGYLTKKFRLRGELIWPEGSTAIWPCVIEAKDISREDLLEFCNRFIIELELPPASETLYEPGPLEQALLALVAEKIGIGRYPNQDRSPQDFAALMLSLANLARTQEATITPSYAEKELDLRTDYGRIAQDFPLDMEVFVDREEVRDALYEKALKGKSFILTGPPGSGKSWELTRLADQLHENGAIVARHYCYLEPGDEHVERRITENAFFGNLIAELIDAAPALKDKTKRHYSAGLNELEDLLLNAVDIGRPIVLIIDGLDHISRVLAGARHITASETDIIDQITTLKKPDGVSLIIGSQPGAHLEPLNRSFNEDIEVLNIPGWSYENIVSLTERMSIDSAFLNIGDTGPKLSSLKLLYERSEGNPLYATYLIKELIYQLSFGFITDIDDWLRGAPSISGNIAKYYEYLYLHASETGKAISDVIGLIDFGVSENDLREILKGPLQSWIPDALKHLNPILTEVSAQGGVRIFHESFRRFITEKIQQEGRSVSEALQPVMDWLSSRGFYSCAKAYRFLLPMLRRAGLFDDALNKIGVDFVSKSVANGHPIEAVARNISTAIDIAAKKQLWPDIIRCVELHRSAYTCYEEKLYNPLPFWEAYMNIFGPDALVERLLFDGQLTQDAETGILLCSIADDAGAIPPWQEYLKISKQDIAENNRIENGQRTREEEISLARLHGLIRVEGYDKIQPSILSFLIESGEHAKPWYLIDLGKRVALTADRESIENLITDYVSNSQIVGKYRPEISSYLHLGLAEVLFQFGELAEASKVAKAALSNTKNLDLALKCFEYGAPYSGAAKYAVEPSKLSLGFNEYSPDDKSINEWVASIILLSGVKPSIIEAEKNRITGDGWYRCWLKYVIGLGKTWAEVRITGNSTRIVSAFDELKRDTEPFRGKPRSSDLYKIHGIILETIEYGFKLIRSESDWVQILNILYEVIENTSTSLQRSPSGPIRIEAIIELLLPYAAKGIATNSIKVFCEKLIEFESKTGTYFENHAEYSMLAARLYKAVGDDRRASDSWEQVGVYLGGYGFRKDVTVYEILDSIPALMGSGLHNALDALSVCQPFTNALFRHTDGRSTKRSTNAWFKALLDCDPPSALAFLSITMNDIDRTSSWIIEEALEDSLKEISDSADISLLWSVFLTVPFSVYDEHEAREKADDRLNVISRLLNQDRIKGSQAFQLLTAQIAEDERHKINPAIVRLREFAEKENIILPQINEIKTNIKTEDNYVNRKNSFDNIPLSDRIRCHESFFFSVDNPTDLIAGIRRITSNQKSYYHWDSFITAFGYRLITILNQGRDDEAVRLLRYFSREAYITSDTAHPLAQLAEGLERYGYIRIAAIAFALSYVKSRGGHGWQSIGDENHESSILRAINLSREDALQILSDEIAYQLRNISGVSIGITSNLIMRIAAWGEAEAAKDSWWSAYGVIAHRIPLITDTEGVFKPLVAGKIPQWSTNEGLVALLVARITNPKLYIKIPAINGLAEVIRNNPEYVSRPLRELLTLDTQGSNILIILKLLLECELTPYPISTDLCEVLEGYAACNLWGVRILADLLLERCGIKTDPCQREIPELDKVAISESRRRATLSLDKNNRIQRIGRLWPELPFIVSQRFDDIFMSAEIHKERFRATWKMANGEHKKNVSHTPVLEWIYELFETAFQESMNGFNPYLWSKGKWTPEIEKMALNIILPNIKVHLGVDGCKTLRPQYPEPMEQEQGQSNIISLEDDPLYQGWLRLAYFEEQWSRSENKSFSQPDSHIMIMAGAVIILLAVT
jgi:AAA ATPase domain